MKSLLIRRLTAVILLVTLCSCQTWHSAELKDIRDGNEERTHDIRLYFPDGTVDLRENWILDYPRITGYVKESEGNVPREPGPPYGKTQRTRWSLLISIRCNGWNC